jgi:acetyl-CoA carboxylase carboxyltransferase component
MEPLDETRPYGVVHGLASHRYEQDGKRFNIHKRRMATASELKEEVEEQKKAEAAERARQQEMIKLAEKREAIIDRLAEAEEALQEVLEGDDDKAVIEAERVVEFIEKELREFDESN